MEFELRGENEEVEAWYATEQTGDFKSDFAAGLKFGSDKKIKSIEVSDFDSVCVKVYKGE